LSNNLKCPICLDIDLCISQPRSKHSLCISCFKRCYYGDENEGEPIFPYYDVVEEYFNDQENIKWENDYPLIKIYKEELNKWDDEKRKKSKDEENLKKMSFVS
jgi:hypothetical protein